MRVGFFFHEPGFTGCSFKVLDIVRAVVVRSFAREDLLATGIRLTGERATTRQTREKEKREEGDVSVAAALLSQD